MVTEYYQIKSDGDFINSDQLNNVGADVFKLYPYTIGSMDFQNGKIHLAINSCEFLPENPNHSSIIKIYLNGSYRYKPCCNKFKKTIFEKDNPTWKEDNTGL